MCQNAGSPSAPAATRGCTRVVPSVFAHVDIKLGTRPALSTRCTTRDFSEWRASPYISCCLRVSCCDLNPLPNNYLCSIKKYWLMDTQNYFRPATRIPRFVFFFFFFFFLFVRHFGNLARGRFSYVVSFSSSSSWCPYRLDQS